MGQDREETEKQEMGPRQTQPEGARVKEGRRDRVELGRESNMKRMEQRLRWDRAVTSVRQLGPSEQ